MSQANLPGNNHISQPIYERIGDSINSLVQNAKGGVVAPYTVDMMDWDFEEGITVPGATPIGTSRRFGSIDGDGWTRFTAFDPAAEPLMRHGLNYVFTDLKSQMEFDKQARGAKLQGVLRVIEREERGRIHLALSGELPSINDQGRTAHEFYRFARSIGLDTLWRRIEESPLEVSMQGWINTQLGRPIASALGELVTART